MNEQQQPPINIFEHKRRLVLEKRNFHQHQVDILNSELARLSLGIETIAEKQIRARLPRVLTPIDVPLDPPRVPRNMMPPFDNPDYESDDPWVNGMYGHEL